MHRFTTSLRKPVKREGAEQYLLVTLLSFASSVTLTRIFLELTGYPQLGGGDLHIAHVLWGGLLLFAASLLPLIVANRWAFMVGAVLAGGGVGLFIDEVGKFITANNDYFHPLAAPIIYAFFLLVVLLYIRVRRPSSSNPRAEFFRALDSLEEVLEHDLDPRELADLERRLLAIANQTEMPELARLAGQLLVYLPSLSLVSERPGLRDRLRRFWQIRAVPLISRNRLKAVLSGGLLALGIVNIQRMAQKLPLTTTMDNLVQAISALVEGGQIRNVQSATWFLTSSALEALTGLLLAGSALLLILGKEKAGIRIGFASLLISLSMINLLIFYFDQFSTILTASIQLILLLGLSYYRRLYLPDSF